MSASTLDTVLTTYLSLHAVLALLIDAQSVLPDLAPSVLAAYQRAGLTQPVARWVADEGDFLVGSNPLWFRWIVGGEVLFQLPVCIALAFGFAKRRQWVRLPSLLYGTHVLTYVEATPAMADQSRPSGGWAEASQGSGQPPAWPGAESSLRRASWPKAERRWFAHGGTRDEHGVGLRLEAAVAPELGERVERHLHVERDACEQEADDDLT